MRVLNLKGQLWGLSLLLLLLLFSLLVSCNSVIFPLYPALDMIMWDTTIQMFKARATMLCFGVGSNRADGHSFSTVALQPCWTDRLMLRSKAQKVATMNPETKKKLLMPVIDLSKGWKYRLIWSIPHTQFSGHTRLCACFSSSFFSFF